MRSRNLGIAVEPGSSVITVADKALSPMSQISEAASVPVDGGAPATATSTGRVNRPNVAGLGASLYTDQLVTVAIAGALLFVALLGAVAITNPRRPIRPGTDPSQVAAVGTSRP
jgi:NADH:ubiquinone oxidoreductase subunit 6 (subunit J)